MGCFWGERPPSIVGSSSERHGYDARITRLKIGSASSFSRPWWFLSQTKVSSCLKCDIGDHCPWGWGSDWLSPTRPRAHCRPFCARRAASCQSTSGCRSTRSEAHLGTLGAWEPGSLVRIRQSTVCKSAGRLFVWEHSSFFARNPPRVPPTPSPGPPPPDPQSRSIPATTTPGSIPSDRPLQCCLRAKVGGLAENRLAGS